MNAMKCDRCGAFYEPKPDVTDYFPWMNYELIQREREYSGKKVDLCYDCKYKLFKWIQGGQK